MTRPLPGDAAAGDAPSYDWTQTTNPPTTPVPPQAPAPGVGFTPGTILVGRYRVVARLGHGGMGEVYRADDTKLNQPVALKFVRDSLSPELLQRLYAEVRIGRQVAHPNVCRLYDVVEAEGHTFLAMEYVDGEDLDSLLGRIGRLPGDKALDLARDLCAGLAAAHEKGIVHRDLKPANVMLDGRGRARLTDFGVAVVLDAAANHGFAGTPAYMSPEALQGAPVTFRSDLYALGLVLFEMLTGQRFFDARTMAELGAQHRESKAGKLAAAARFLSSPLDHVVRQCLEEDPQARPASARAILALLPGGDPLDAAVAAGETPSPEAVQAAATVGDLSPVTAWALLLTVLGSLALSAFIADRTALVRLGPPPRSPDVLAERAHDVLARLGHSAGADAAYSFEWDMGQIDHIAEHDPTAASWRQLVSRPFAPLVFFYRQSPERLVAGNRDAMITRSDPPPDVSGMAEVVLDARGRLTSFAAVPPQRETPPPAGTPVDWGPLFAEAGLDDTKLRPAAPEWAAPVDSDEKAAWVGQHPTAPDLAIRVEAAAYHGRPVWFAVLPPWARTTRMVDGGLRQRNVPFAQVALWILAVAMPVGGLVLARRNLRLGRVDRTGAFRVALYVFVVYALARFFRADHVTVFGDELWILIKIAAYPALWAMQVWLLYVALEPYARRRWPRMLISWKRLLGGQLRDPLVGRDFLIGAVAGSLSIVGFLLSQEAPTWLGMPPITPEPFVHGPTYTSMRHMAFRFFVNQYGAILYALVFLFMLVLFRMLFRSTLLAMILWCALVGSPIQGENLPVEWAFGLVFRSAVMLFALTRGGLLALTAALFFMFLILETPLTLDVSAWYAARGLPVLAALMGMAAWAFHVSLGGKPAFGGALLDD